MVVRDLVGEAAALGSWHAWHQNLADRIRGHYPMNEVPPELVGELRHLEWLLGQVTEGYGKLLRTELPEPTRTAA